jgi:hypothetical protein
VPPLNKAASYDTHSLEHYQEAQERDRTSEGDGSERDEWEEEQSPDEYRDDRVEDLPPDTGHVEWIVS